MKPRVGRALCFSANLLSLSIQHATYVQYISGSPTIICSIYLYKANVQTLLHGNQVLEIRHNKRVNRPLRTSWCSCITNSVIANKTRSCSKVNDWCCCRATSCKCIHMSHDIMPPLLLFFCCKLKVNIRNVALHFLDLLI